MKNLNSKIRNAALQQTLKYLNLLKPKNKNVNVQTVYKMY